MIIRHLLFRVPKKGPLLAAEGASVVGIDRYRPHKPSRRMTERKQSPGIFDKEDPWGHCTGSYKGYYTELYRGS